MNNNTVTTQKELHAKWNMFLYICFIACIFFAMYLINDEDVWRRVDGVSNQNYGFAAIAISVLPFVCVVYLMTLKKISNKVLKILTILLFAYQFLFFLATISLGTISLVFAVSSGLLAYCFIKNYKVEKANKTRE